MNINIISSYFILLIVCVAKIIAITNNMIHDIGSQLCPYTCFCQRNATPHASPIYCRPCCSKYSCEENCGETEDCGPDQDVIDNKKPITKCKTTAVKKGDGFSEEIWGIE